MTIEEYTCTITYKEILMNPFMERYHFDAKDRQMIEATVRFACELIKVQMVVGYREDGIICAITLGAQYDKLSDAVGDHLLLSYCLECVGMELLSKAYEKVNLHVYEKKGYWIGNYQFPEGEKAREQLRCLHTSAVVWKKGMLHPAKSVILVAGYVTDKKQSGCEHCVHCGNTDCVFRKKEEKENSLSWNGNASAVGTSIYSYGIQRIFGNDRKSRE